MREYASTREYARVRASTREYARMFDGPNFGELKFSFRLGIIEYSIVVRLNILCTVT